MIRCFRDKHGFPRVDAGAACAALAAFLEQDVQSDGTYCKELLATIARIENGQEKQWSATGNAHEISVSADEAMIANLWVESAPPCKLSLSEFKAALEEWASFVNGESIAR